MAWIPYWNGALGEPGCLAGHSEKSARDPAVPLDKPSTSVSLLLHVRESVNSPASLSSQSSYEAS